MSLGVILVCFTMIVWLAIRLRQRSYEVGQLRLLLHDAMEDLKAAIKREANDDPSIDQPDGRIGPFRENAEVDIELFGPNQVLVGTTKTRFIVKIRALGPVIASDGDVRFTATEPTRLCAFGTWIGDQHFVKQFTREVRLPTGDTFSMTMTIPIVVRDNGRNIETDSPTPVMPDTAPQVPTS